MVNEISLLRKLRGWSQADLARELGVHQSTVSRLEDGQEPSGPVRKLIEQLLATSDSAQVSA